MKKFLFAAFAVLAFGAVNAQGFKGGAHVGLPIGTSGDAFSFNAGVDVSYTWEVADNFSAGVATGYTMFFGKSIEGEKIPSVGLLPIAGTASYKVADNIFLGADLGYALGVSNASGGDIYYQPKVGYAAEKFDAFVGYKGLGSNFNAITLGASFKF
jgi:hypothetical protein